MWFIQTIISIFFWVLSTYCMQPSIVNPVNGTVINPGEAFDFHYQSIADYGTSSYNYTIWLFTSIPNTNFATLDNFAEGYYFGRYAQPNYPGNPSPPNPPPSRLTMPNFAKSGGGFGTGAETSNATFYLAVLEEYATGKGSVGYRMSLSFNYIFYNRTQRAL